jgi:hypothetical protein
VASSAGGDYFQRMIMLARQKVPDSRSVAVFDCGTATGLALAALRAGFEAVSISTSDGVREKLATIASQTGSFIVDTPPHATRDLADFDDPQVAAAALIDSAELGNCAM